MVLHIFEQWAAALKALDIPGSAFLRLWLRRGTLEPILLRELGPNALNSEWHQDGHARLRPFPLGVIGHWPAGNIDIQPILSLTCALLGGNSCLVRVPLALVESVRQVMAKLHDVDQDCLLTERIFILTFDHSRRDLHEAMAKVVDGAMIWGGEDAVGVVRALPFPSRVPIAVFGPRISVAAMDAGVWSDRTQRSLWCRRVARDVWQFEQQACSSPQTLFLETDKHSDSSEFVEDLKLAFQEENRMQPAATIQPSLTSAICSARASWLLDSATNSATFPQSPDWTILVGRSTELREPVQGRTLTVLLVDNLEEVISTFDGDVQTLGLAIKDRKREETIAEVAGRHGVDRIVKLGRMHVFTSPWDGLDLIRPMVRLVRHVQSQD
jgi:hypothetical protein